MDAKTRNLVNAFGKSLDRFDELFTGSRRTDRQLETYLHARQIRSAPEFRLSTPPREFAVACHDMLRSWNMHSRGARLVAPDTLAESLTRHGASLLPFENLSLTSSTEADMRANAVGLWDVLSQLEVGEQQTRIVANTKLGHILFPNLVPPFDNKYTLAFFVIPSFSTHNEGIAFSEVMIRFARIASECSSEIARRPKSGWHTTPPKVIDNAIQGFDSRGSP